mmetsp:Transcript_19588/g.33339  ORF Transcript_19588/g.33339 Transcript_19588/m.33339 type:complete len:306 (-) Transcript_19588:928-1845(-)
MPRQLRLSATRAAILTAAFLADVLTRVGTTAPITAPPLPTVHFARTLLESLYADSTSRNRRRSPGFAWDPSSPLGEARAAGSAVVCCADHVGMRQPPSPHVKACSAIFFHLAASDHLMSSRFAMPLMRIVARPSSTSSCGNEAIALIGESADSSWLEKPPGICASGSPKSRRARAAAASGFAPSTKVTPNWSILRWAASISLGEPPVSCHSLTRRIASASCRRYSVEICLTWPQSMRETLAPSWTKMLPGCGSPWMKPAPSIMRPKASESCCRMRRPASFDSGEPGLIPLASITPASRLRGVPSM